MTNDLSLGDYGRLMKDGEVNVLLPGEVGNPKMYYVFLFTRVLIVCKPAAVSSFKAKAYDYQIIFFLIYRYCNLQRD